MTLYFQALRSWNNMVEKLADMCVALEDSCLPVQYEQLGNQHLHCVCVFVCVCVCVCVCECVCERERESCTPAVL